MVSTRSNAKNKNKTDEIIIKSINKPDKREARKQVEKLAEYLSEVWYMPI